MSKKSKTRFAFTIKDGTNAGSTSGPWVVWTHKDDIYIAPEELSGMWKVSLHGDAAWRLAMTAEHVASGIEPQLPQGVDRAMWKWVTDELPAPPFVDGVRLTFVVATTRAALLSSRPLDDRSQHIAVDDRWDVLTMVRFLMTEPGVELTDVPRPVGRSMLLSNGRRLWMAVATESVVGEPEVGIEGAMVEVMSPATHDVSVPGLLLKGLRLG